jgi:hypothetical protein
MPVVTQYISKWSVVSGRSSVVPKHHHFNINKSSPHACSNSTKSFYFYFIIGSRKISKFQTSIVSKISVPVPSDYNFGTSQVYPTKSACEDPSSAKMASLGHVDVMNILATIST